MLRALCEAAIATAVISVVAVAGASALAQEEDQRASACAVATSWRSAAASLQRLSSGVAVDGGDDRDVVGLGRAYQTLASISLPSPDEGRAVALVGAMQDANDAAQRWLSDGFSFVALANSGVASDTQYETALEGYERSRVVWDEAAQVASVELTSSCEIAPIDEL